MGARMLTRFHRNFDLQNLLCLKRKPCHNEKATTYDDQLKDSGHRLQVVSMVCLPQSLQTFWKCLSSQRHKSCKWSSPSSVALCANWPKAPKNINEIATCSQQLVDWHWRHSVLAPLSRETILANFSSLSYLSFLFFSFLFFSFPFFSVLFCSFFSSFISSYRVLSYPILAIPILSHLSIPIYPYSLLTCQL